MRAGIGGTIVDLRTRMRNLMKGNGNSEVFSLFQAPKSKSKEGLDLYPLIRRDGIVMYLVVRVSTSEEDIKHLVL